MPETIFSVVEAYRNRFRVRKPYFSDLPPKNVCLIIAIPAYKEPYILETLESLAVCEPPDGTVEVIVTINAPENATAEVLAVNMKTHEQIRQWERSNKSEFLKILVIREEAIPEKQVGAGMARKIGMDEAVQRWANIGKDGPIVCLDADCTVSKNYLTEAEKTFADPSIMVSHFNFEHRYQNESDLVLREGIILYELHLRCYILGLQAAGYPFAVHTVGSCMAVRASAYAKAGGMNTRKAGEDFYFLHKLAPLGGWKNSWTATVFPSCRVSDRVPFGTGLAQLEWSNKTSTGSTYNAELYRAMMPLFEVIPKLYNEDFSIDHVPQQLKSFLLSQQVFEKLAEIKKQSNSREAFAKRCWQCIDGFMVLKLTHFLRDNGFPDQPVVEVAQTLIKEFSEGFGPVAQKPEALLTRFRLLEKTKSAR